MNLPVVFEPSVASDDDSTLHFTLAMEVSRKARKPTLADMDEYWDFCRAAEHFSGRNRSA